MAQIHIACACECVLHTVVAACMEKRGVPEPMIGLCIRDLRAS